MAALTKAQSALAILISPLKHLVGVHSMLTRHSRYRRAGNQGRFYYPTLLLGCPAHSLGPNTCRLDYGIAHLVILLHRRRAVYTALHRTLTDKRRRVIKQREIMRSQM